MKPRFLASLLAAASVMGSIPDARAASIIPLCPGLTVVTAVSQVAGDYESIKTIQAVSDTEVRMHYSAEVSENDPLGPGPELKHLNLERLMLTKDLESATDYQQLYLEGAEEKIPGTTSIGTSSAVLRDLKSKGQSAFGWSNAYGGLALSADTTKSPNYYSYLQKGTIQRAAGPATVSVLVNDKPMDLPVVRAQGDFYGDKTEFVFLDDPTNPLTLAFRIGIDGVKPLIPEQLEYCALMVKNNGGKPVGNLPFGLHCDTPKGGDRDVLHVVKIAYNCQGGPPPGSGGGGAPGGGKMPGGLGAVAGGGGGDLEAQLAKQQKVDIYSIYFSFNSDAIRDESTPTLKEIADIMGRHPDWRLAVNGHTDSIGGDSYNLDLSKRRATAVVNALVTRYHINADRLRSSGIGRSQPKDTNDTLEGRARNRRVELMRF
jgi:outer membrane protein OmpA-like peptidoglycan-associated protein